jgi:hypothetical protein
MLDIMQLTIRTLNILRLHKKEEEIAVLIKH